MAYCENFRRTKSRRLSYRCKPNSKSHSNVREQAFLKLKWVGWLLVLFPIITVIIIVIILYREKLTLALESYYMMSLIFLIVCYEWWTIIRNDFHNTFIKFKQDKKMLLLIPVYMILGLFPVFLYPLILSKKFIGTKKEQKVLKIQGIVGLVMFIIQVILSLVILVFSVWLYMG